MIRLFIDTSNMDVSTSCFKDHILLSSIHETIPNMHSVYAVPYVKKVLDASSLTPNDVDEILVCHGPGSFTGIRIGLTIGKVYAYSLKKKIKLISSLCVLALGQNAPYIMSVIDARNDNYYFGLYDKEGSLLEEERFGSKEELIFLLKKYDDVLLVGYEEFKIEEYVVQKSKIDFAKIDAYADHLEEVNVHQANPNYLKDVHIG